MKQEFTQDLDYWIHKTKVFLHDPPDKAIHIPGHEERANDILAAMGLVGSTLSKEEYQAADVIASGMDRACLPGYVPDNENRNGAVDFYEQPQLTHPTGADSALPLNLPDEFGTTKAAADSITTAIQDLVKEDLGCEARSGKGLSERPEYQGKETAFAPARFHYLHFMLRRRLAKENVGGLGALWHRLPADTRLPDHSIWHHCGLVSALASCQRLSEQNKASLMVYALTPVQDFVGRARKLRDYYSGSIILSWLAFEGIKAVIHRYGADHIVYPSLHGQPLVDELLQQWGMKAEWFGPRTTKGIASFPNKFVCLVPAGQERETAEIIEVAIGGAWRELGNKTLEFVADKVEKIGLDESISQQFHRQMDSYWEHHWTAAPLIKGTDRAAVEELLHKGSIDPAFEFWKDADEIWSSSGEGPLYSVSHRLVQAGLAAGKSRREDMRPAEKGIKCDLFGEFEILHYHHADQSDNNPKPSEDPFWLDIRSAFRETADFGTNERLCALGMVKRLSYRVCKEMKTHPLHQMFKDAETFPSSTEMALHDWWQQLNNWAADQDDPYAPAVAQELAVFDWRKDSGKARRKVAQWLHGLNEEKAVRENGCEIEAIDLRNEKEKRAARELFELHPVKIIHKYYAVLMMDGDRMGKLINGETLGSTWGSVIHPTLFGRLRGSFDETFKKFWEKRMQEPRLVSPAVHAAISEALGDFSIHTVPAIMKRYHGHLIYAGGDDVCAVLPASTALLAARDIAKAYGQGFVHIEPGKQPEPIEGSCPEGLEGKLGVHLGLGVDISISAGIMIAHHKKPLGGVIDRAHALLNMAKKEGIHGDGRNGFALEVDKRSGGGRTFLCGWDEEVNGTPLLDHFLATAEALRQTEEAAMSSSLAYRLAAFEDGLVSLRAHHPAELRRFIVKQLDRSGLNRELLEDQKKRQLEEIATHVAALIERKDHATDGKENVPLESLIVANFIGHCQDQGEYS
jgi:CRISPR-associated protein Cmr2